MSITALSFLREAIKAVPAVRYALGVGGIAATVAIIVSFRIDPLVAFVGTVLILVLMGVLVVFARMTALAGPLMMMPALVFTWFTLIMFMTVTVLLCTSVFAAKPVDLQHWIGVKKKLEQVSSTHYRFYYPFDNPGKGWRDFSKIGEFWHQRYPDGKVDVFREFGRATVAGNHGLLLQKVDEDFQVFIPDEGSPQYWMRLRHGNGPWGDLNYVE